MLALHLRPGTREWFLGWLEREHPVEQVGKRLRALMPWINAKSV